MNFTATVNGLTIGTGTSYRWAQWPEGLLSTAAPDLRRDAKRARQQGVYPQPEWMTGRLVVFDLWVLADTIEAAEQLVAVARAAFAPSVDPAPDTLTVEVSGSPATYVLYGKPRGLVAAPAATFRNGTLRARAEFFATDPRLYSNTPSSVVGTLSASSGGLTFAASAPFVFGSAGGGGTFDCPNAGTFETPYRITFTGPLTAPAVEHTGQTRRLDFSGGTLLAGETLVVDSLARTALFNGTASRYSWLSNLSQWFTLEPGPNPLRFTAASGTGTCQVDYRSAWI